MEMTKQAINQYLNPFTRLGKSQYSALLPLIVTTFAAIFSEIVVVGILKDPQSTGLIAIFVFIVLIIYFAFRDGLLGGFITTGITILYYLYIVFTRQSDQLASGLQATALFGASYFAIAGIIGWLRQTIDTVIEQEIDARRRLQAIVQQLPVGVIFSDHHGTIKLANKQAENILGLKIPIGHAVDQLSFVPATQKGALAPSPKKMLTRMLKTGTPVSNEYQIHRPDGIIIQISSSTNFIKNPSGKVIATATIIEDITEKKELEARKDDFVNMASHELKTPLTSLKLYLSYLTNLLSVHPNSKANQILVKIQTQTDKLQKLVSDLLDISRLQTGKLNFSKESFKLEGLIQEIIDELEGTKTDKRIKFTPRPSVTLSADRFRISQVISNLINNSLKYSSAHTDIKVKLKKADGEVILSVKDFGIGIDKSQFQKIFDRLYQVQDDNEKTFPGFGMGLYIAKEIVVHHRGKIWVESQKGKGSTFYISLPLPKKRNK